jgi:hypothetical protein
MVLNLIQKPLNKPIYKNASVLIEETANDFNSSHLQYIFNVS